MFSTAQIVVAVVTDAVRGVWEFVEELFDEGSDKSADPDLTEIVAKVVSAVVLAVSMLLGRSESVLVSALAASLAFVARKVWLGVTVVEA